MNAGYASSQTEHSRAAPRARLFLSAVIRFGAVSVPIRLRDLSAEGVRIEGKTLPEVGASAAISRGSLHASGTVIWRDRQSCGLRFDTRLKIDDWMPTRVADDQPAMDRKVGDGAMVQSLRELLPARIAEELAFVSRMLESLGDDLAGEPLIVSRHAAKLQHLDISMQILGHVAGLLVAPDPEKAVDSIGMVALRKRLRRSAL